MSSAKLLLGLLAVVLLLAGTGCFIVPVPSDPGGSGGDGTDSSTPPEGSPLPPVVGDPLFIYADRARLDQSKAGTTDTTNLEVYGPSDVDLSAIEWGLSGEVGFVESSGVRVVDPSGAAIRPDLVGQFAVLGVREEGGAAVPVPGPEQQFVINALPLEVFEYVDPDTGFTQYLSLRITVQVRNTDDEVVAERYLYVDPPPTPSPVVTATDPNSDELVNGLVEVSVTFSEEVSGVQASDLAVAGSEATAVAGTGAGPYVFSGFTVADGVLKVVLAPGSIVDASGNGFLGYSWTVTLDTTAPTVEAVQVISGGSAEIDVVYSEAVDLAAADNAANYALSGSGQGALAAQPDFVYAVDPDRYRLVWLDDEMLDGGDITVTVQNIVDVAGNPLGTPNAATAAGEAIGVVPTVTVEQAPFQADPASVAPVTFVATFSEPVVGFEAADVDLSASTVAGPLTATVQSVNPSVYTIEVTGMSSDGQVVCTVPAGAAADAAGNASAAPEPSVDNQVGFVLPRLLSIADAQIAEGDAGVQGLDFQVTVAPAPTADSGAVTVQWATLDDSAKSSAPDIDYQPASGTVTFAVGETDKTVTVSISGDVLDETDESFLVTLSNPTNATIADGQAVGTILDDDAYNAPTIDIADVQVVEGDVGQEEAIFEVTLDAPATLPVSVDYATADGSATAPADYVAVAGVLQFAVGQTKAEIVVQVNCDTDVEGDEAFAMNLSNAVNANIGTAAAAGLIVDDDAAAVVFAQASSVVDENVAGGTHTFDLQLNVAGGPTAGNIELRVTDPGTGTAIAGHDYTFDDTQVLMFPVGSVDGATLPVEITINDDALVEGDETVVLQVQIVSGPATLGSPGTHQVKLRDDEVTVAFASAASATNDEVDGQPGVQVQLSFAGGGIITAPVSVDVVEVAGGTATPNVDYTAFGPVTLVFPAGSKDGDVKVFQLPVIQDSLVEGDETVDLELQNVVGPAGLGAQATHAATITDDDFAEVRLTAATSATADEAAVAVPMTVELVINSVPAGGTLAVPVTVDVADDGTGSATAADDYASAMPVQYAFPAGSAAGTLVLDVLTIVQDDLVEGDETVDLSLQNLTGPATPGAPAAHAVTITDDDFATVQLLNATSATPDESATAYSIGVDLAINSVPAGGSLAVPVTVDVVDAGTGSATAGADYTTPAPATFTFPAGSTAGPKLGTVLTVVQDNLVEGDETVDLSLQNETGPVTLGGLVAHAATITDDDFASVRLAQASNLTIEPAGVHNLVVQLVILSNPAGGSLAVPVTVDVADAGTGSATSGADYGMPAPVTFTFPIGSNSTTLDQQVLTLVDDDLVEGDETVDLVLQNVSAPAGLGAQVTHELTISGLDDTARVQFAAATSATVDESAAAHPVAVELVINSSPAGGSLAVPVTVEVADAGTGSATLVDDYTTTTPVLYTFPVGSAAGATAQDVLAVVQDNLVEGDETVDLVLQNVSASAGLGAQVTHQATITDDDFATVRFAIPASVTIEPAGIHNIVVQLVIDSVPAGGSLAADVFVDVADAGTGTATIVDDYDLVASPVVFAFPAGSGSVTLQQTVLTLVDDPDPEANDTVDLVLQNVLGPATIDPLAMDHEVTIQDDDAPPAP